MKKTTSLIVLMTGLLLAGASETAAQTPLGGKLFVNINGGGQTQSHTISNGGSLSVFSQTASWTTTGSVPSGGLFDISVGYKVWRELGLALGYSSFSPTGTIVGTASVPDPISFSRPPTQLTITETPAPRSDRNVYVLAVWFFPITEKIDLSFSIGPSFTRVEQDVVVDTQEFRQRIVDAASSHANITPSVQTQSGNSTGVNVGVDGRYMFTKIIGAGAFMRYNGGSLDLPDAPGLNVGGFQLGVGAHLRF